MCTQVKARRGDLCSYTYPARSLLTPSNHSPHHNQNKQHSFPKIYLDWYCKMPSCCSRSNPYLMYCCCCCCFFIPPPRPPPPPLSTTTSSPSCPGPLLLSLHNPLSI